MTIRKLLAATLLVVFAGFALAADEPKKIEPKAAEKEAPKFDAKMLEGKWTVTEYTKNGEKGDAATLKDPVVITKDKISLKAGGAEFDFKYTLDAKADPMTIELEITSETFKGSKAPGLIKLDGDKLMIAYHGEGKERPKDFKSAKDSGFNSFTMTKAKEDKKEEKKPTATTDK